MCCWVSEAGGEEGGEGGEGSHIECSWQPLLVLLIRMP
jgi:hypothetical protein